MKNTKSLLTEPEFPSHMLEWSQLLIASFIRTATRILWGYALLAYIQTWLGSIRTLLSWVCDECTNELSIQAILNEYSLLLWSPLMLITSFTNILYFFVLRSDCKSRFANITGEKVENHEHQELPNMLWNISAFCRSGINRCSQDIFTEYGPNSAFLSLSLHRENSCWHQW